MRRTFGLVSAVLLAFVIFTACGSDDTPTSFQMLIFSRWTAQDAFSTFREITFTEGSSQLVGTYVATILFGNEEIQETGSIRIAGSTLIVDRPDFEPANWPFSIDGNTLTLTTNLGPEIYVR